MKRIDYLFIAILITGLVFFLFGCQKQTNQGYRITNLSGCDLKISTSGQAITLKSTKQTYFVSENEPKFQLEDENLKIKLTYLGTYPQKSIQVSSYLHEFAVKVANRAYSDQDEVEIIINGKYFKEKLPFYYGTDEIPGNYSVTSNPINEKGLVFTQVFKNGYCVDIDENKCRLTGQL